MRTHRTTMARVFLVTGAALALSAIAPAAQSLTGPHSVTGAASGTQSVTTQQVCPTPAATVSVATVRTEVSYGPNPCQVVTVRRNGSTHQRTVIFFHGGGWTKGDRSTLEYEAKEWAADGWTTYNAEYRLGTVDDGTPDDGKAILEDANLVLQLARSSPYVDPNRIVVYGESAGGHLATWLGSFYGSQVKAIVAVSPVTSIAGAINAGLVTNPTPRPEVVALGHTAQEFFGYSVGTTDAHRYMDRVQHARIVVGVNPTEWLDPAIHGRKFCTDLGTRCRLTEIAGGQHAGEIIGAHPELRADLRAWARTQTR